MSESKLIDKTFDCEIFLLNPEGTPKIYLTRHLETGIAIHTLKEHEARTVARLINLELRVFELSRRI